METTRSSEMPRLSVVIVPRNQIRRRVGELAAEITEAFGNRGLTIVGVLDGALVFLADLIRRLPMRLELLTVGVRSYRGRDGTAGEIEFRHRLRTDLAGQHVLIVDDILDTGATLSAALEETMSHEPASCRTCVLLRKKRGRGGSSLAGAVDFVGFDIPDVFVVGYGLDFDGRYRNLPDIVALQQVGGQPR
ncbi:MAG: hypothetical protein AMJ81_02330 [Phycisphaerae bacterium SM23_33]|nr:MAG: hypothetical protein AMJ81_02330 [Phycisphaerae bacterium SM23_33]